MEIKEYKQYTVLELAALRAKGLHKKYNPLKDYRTAKEPVTTGFTDAAYKGLTLDEIKDWQKQGGWIGWVLPEDVIFLDEEDPIKIDYIEMICKKYGIEPPENITKNGIHLGFKTTKKIPGASKKETKSGFKTTYRAKGNYLILPPTDGRYWRVPLNGGLPELPLELCPYDLNNIADVLNVLAWHVGEAHRQGAFNGYEDIELAAMDYLFEHGMGAEEIHKAFKTIFLTAYDARRTQAIYERLQGRKEKGEKVTGAGSFVKAVKDKGLVDILGYMQQFERLTGKGKFQNTLEWPDPIPFDDNSLLPDFPLDALTDPGRSLVKSVAENTQVDIGLPAAAYLSVLSACMGKKVVIDLITHCEPTNLYVMSINDSGERKSSCLNIITNPLYKFQTELQEKLKDTVSTAESHHKTLELRLAKKQKEAANTEDSGERKNLSREAAELAMELSRHPTPALPTIVADDVTPEKTAILLSENDETLSIFSTEGGILETYAGRYSNDIINIDLFLKAHSGDPYSVHRVGRPSINLKSPCLTFCLTVQPDVISELGKNKHFRGRGLIARILFNQGKPQAGSRNRKTRGISSELLEKYHARITQLLEVEPATSKLRLTPEAQYVWDEFYLEVEADMRQGQNLEYLKDWGSKLPGQVARIAALLHFAALGVAAFTNEINEETVVAACAIGAYYKEHALAVFGMMQEDPRIEAAKRILEYIKIHKPDKFKGRDVLMNKNAFKTMEDVTPGLNVLRERGFIRARKNEHSGAGRPEATIFDVNPKFFQTL